jgi:hypothetical protein
VKLVVPYVQWPLELAEHLAEQGLSARFCDTSGPEGYWLLLSRLWDEHEDFILLEADKFPAAGALEELQRCEEPWCAHRVPMRDAQERSPYPSLACTKFAGRLMHLVPDLMVHVGELDLGLGMREWSRLDLAVSGLLEPYVPCHYHQGLVEHRHRH